MPGIDQNQTPASRTKTSSKAVVSRSPRARALYCALGLFATSLGIIGALLPVMPTTCFMLVALWAFSKSSPRLHKWLWEHKRFGASLRRWEEHRCIPIEAKVAALVSMTGSLLFVLLFTPLAGFALAATIAFLALGAVVVLRIPSLPTQRSRSNQTGSRASS
ncbi:MAG: YbaN family protein [Kofleriaceae bacterium]|nr:YbaN family protein [Kofleriaceae bacterium]